MGAVGSGAGERRDTQFVEHQVRFVRDFGISIVGGCCGTTPEYIRQLAAALDGLELPERQRPRPGLTAAGVQLPPSSSRIS